MEWSGTIPVFHYRGTHNDVPRSVQWITIERSGLLVVLAICKRVLVSCKNHIDYKICFVLQSQSVSQALTG
eukprot:2906914-Amphidinium_carterae.1